MLSGMNKFIFRLILNYTLLLIVIFLSGLLIFGLITSIYPEERIKIYEDEIRYDDKKNEIYLNRSFGEEYSILILDNFKIRNSYGEIKYTPPFNADFINDVISNPVDNEKNIKRSLRYIETEYGNTYTAIIMEKIPYAPLELSFSTEEDFSVSYYLFDYAFIALLIILTFFSVIVAFALLMSRTVGKPLKKINQGLEKIVEGDYSARLKFKSNFEFEIVRDAFNDLVDKLEKTKRENESIAMSKRKLMLDISHDLRTPITSIKGCSQIIRNNLCDASDEIKRCVEIIDEKSEYIEYCVENMFEFSKLDMCMYKLEFKVQDFTEFVRKILIDNYVDFESKKFELDIEIPDSQVLICIDELEMKRAISNIIGNALKYNKSGTIFMVKISEKQNKIEMIIGDNGTGIPQDIRKNVFDQFVKGKNKNSGTGLGLSITKKIIELHNGSVELLTQDNPGTVYRVVLPVKR